MARLDEYRIMWVFVFFDLPTETKKERRDYARFRKNIMSDGFTMMRHHLPHKPVDHVEMPVQGTVLDGFAGEQPGRRQLEEAGPVNHRLPR